MNNVGGKRTMKNIKTATSYEITKLFTDITSKVILTTISIARRVKSFPFVTDVR
jgi:hypothetical protein